MDKTQYNTTQEILRVRKLAQLKLNDKKTLELTHTLRNLQTIHRLVPEEIYRTAISRRLAWYIGHESN